MIWVESELRELILRCEMTYLDVALVGTNCWKSVGNILVRENSAQKRAKSLPFILNSLPIVPKSKTAVL